MFKTKKKVEMPAGIRNKMVAAVAMLLVASILMVSTTYAWFTLSTAPEVTGITTSVGANGNLEIALLTTESFANTDAISSSVGDSSAHQAVTAANITWGNLVDLSDSTYALNTVNLMPAKPSVTTQTTGEGEEAVTTKLLSLANPLSTPVYGADGRVAELASRSVSAAAAGGNFVYDSAAQSYGVRAVGDVSTMTQKQLTFNSARGSYNIAMTTAARGLASAVSSNAMTFLSIAVTGSAPESYSADQIKGIIAMAQGAQTSLNAIVNAYANAGLAMAASNDETTDDQIVLLKTSLTGVNSAATLKTLLPVNNFNEDLDAIATAQDDIADAIDALEPFKETGATAAELATVQTALNTLYSDVQDAEGNAVGSSNAADLMANGGDVYVVGGAIGAIAAQTGNTLLTTQLGVNVYDGAANTVGKLATVATAVSALTAPGGAAATANITDTFGYILDFAFRTNAADSYLLLQTEAANRVYAEETDEALATQGAGSTVTFDFADGMDSDRATKLVKAVTLLFFDPVEGTVYAQAQVTDTQAVGASVTGKVEIVGQEHFMTNITFGKDVYSAVYSTEDDTTVIGYKLNYVAPAEEGSVPYIYRGQEDSADVRIEKPAPATWNTADITVEAYNALPVSTFQVGAAQRYNDEIDVTADPLADKKIVALDQNVAKKLSVLVYLDGDMVDNSAVINAATSGNLTLNLQFASSATLIPMNNTALKTMTNEAAAPAQNP